MIPFDYALGNLWVRKATAVASVLGIALVVFVIASVLLLYAAIDRTFSKQGSPDMAIVLRRGSSAEWIPFDATSVPVIFGARDVKKAPDGTPLAVAEVVVSVSLKRESGDGNANVRFRGVPDNALAVRPTVHVVVGRAPKPGVHEAMVGQRIRGMFPGFDVGQSIQVRTGRQLAVVGVFEDDGSTYESEVWTDVENLRSFFGVEGSVTSVRARLISADAFDRFKAHVEGDERLGLSAVRETVYYSKLSQDLGQFVGAVGAFIAVVFSLSAMLGAMITMYASVANRQREIGTLRALGFPRRSLLVAILVEAIMLSGIGGALGCAASVALAHSKLSLGDFTTAQEVVFALEPDPRVFLAAFASAAVMGVLGGFLPALRAARVVPVQAMRGH